MPDLRHLLADALKLPPAARGALVGHLIDSLDSTVDADAESLWQVEIERRVAAIDAGEADFVPEAEALARVRRAGGAPNPP